MDATGTSGSWCDFFRRICPFLNQNIPIFDAERGIMSTSNTVPEDDKKKVRIYLIPTCTYVSMNFRGLYFNIMILECIIKWLE